METQYVYSIKRKHYTVYIIQANFAFTQVNVVRGNGVCILVVVD